MKISLFGGAEHQDGETIPELEMMAKVIRESGASQVLHVPFSRTKLNPNEPEWAEGYVERYMDLGDVEYLNAKIDSDIDKADNPLMFVTGGPDRMNLLERIQADERLLSLIKNCEHYIGESSGAMITGEYLQSKKQGVYGPMIPGLGLIPDTVIMPHYSQRNWQGKLDELMEYEGVKYGIGIDTLAAISLDPEVFPGHYDTIGGDRLVEVKTASS